MCSTGSGDYHFVFAPHDGHRIPAPMDRILGAWMLHRLVRHDHGAMPGWEAAGKHTMIVCDELSMLSSADDSSLAHIKDQMRSFGVIAVFATQYPEQLSDLLLRSFMGVRDVHRVQDTGHGHGAADRGPPGATRRVRTAGIRAR